MPPSVYSFGRQAVQVKRLVLGICPGFGQFWQLPLLVNWCDGQVVQLRRSVFGTSPAFGQSSQLPFLVIWFAGQSTVKKIIGFIICIQAKKSVAHRVMCILVRIKPF